jgi:hypothetical protein
MTTPIWPRIIYAIGDLPDGRYYAVVTDDRFEYCRDLPDLFEDLWEEEDTDPDIHVEWDIEDTNPCMSIDELEDALDKAS